MNSNEFEVNKYITLKLEGKDTVIYVDGVRFDMCKILLLNIPRDEVTFMDEIKSIDEVAKRSEKSLESFYNNKHKRISPELEF